MKQPAMELYREGTFTVKGATDLSNRCGITGQGMTYRYEVRLFAPVGSLNGRGFIVDNRAVNLYWVMKYSSPTPKPLPSCEVMAEQACRDFTDLLQREGVALSGCEVRLYGGTHSAVTMRWGEGIWSQAHPVLPNDTIEPVAEPIEAGEPVLDNLAAVLGIGPKLISRTALGFSPTVEPISEPIPFGIVEAAAIIARNVTRGPLGFSPDVEPFPGSCELRDCAPRESRETPEPAWRPF